MNSRKFFRFTSPQETIAGYDALEQLSRLLGKRGLSRPLLVTDKGVAGAGLIELVSTITYASSGMKFSEIYDCVPPDSDTDTVSEIAELFTSRSCDCLIAVGGGSVIDSAKGASIVISAKGDPLDRFQGSDNIPGPLKPLIAVPTTSGTGSEATLVAVIKDPAGKRKLAFSSPWLIPAAAVLDPRMTITLPKAMTAATGMDALTHAVEAYIGLAKNPWSDSFALRSVSLISKFLPKVLQAPHDREARLQMAVASHLAGIAFSNSMVSIVHTIGHSVGAVCGIPHGACMSILLGTGLEYNLHRSAALYLDLLSSLSGEKDHTSVPLEEQPLRFIAELKAFRQQVHELSENTHKLRFRDILDTTGSPVMVPQQIPVIARQAMGDPSQFYNPEEISEEEITAVLKAAYWGYSLDRDLVKKGHQK